MDETKDQVIDVAVALRHFADNQYGDTSYAKEWLNLLADRIDNEYLCLPLDADGVPIRIGDRLESIDGVPTAFMCKRLGLERNGWNIDGHALRPDEVRHVQPDTVESVLAEVARMASKAVDGQDHVWHECDLQGYAERIRKCLD